MINKITIESLVIVAKAITDIGRSAVFAGGSVTPFLITDNASAKPRPTKDIDVIVGTDTRLDYYQLEEELRKRGFSQVIEEDAPLCRWKIKDILVDVMPSNVDILAGIGGQVLHYNILYSIKYFSIRDRPLLLI